MNGKVFGVPVVVCAFEFQFMGGSMGSVVGERFCQAISYCIEHKLPLVFFSDRWGAYAGSTNFFDADGQD